MFCSFQDSESKIGPPIKENPGSAPDVELSICTMHLLHRAKEDVTLLQKK